MSKGQFICIEGGDGSGKGTQHKLLLKRLQAEGRDVEAADFPQYGKPSAELVELYLNNEFGDATKVDPRIASMFFAVDRLAAKERIEARRNAGALILANRFTASNMAHQGAKFIDRTKRIAFFHWLHTTEHDIMHIPEPDYHFILHVPAAIAQQRVLQKATRGYTDKKLDGHEVNLDYQKQAEETYLDLAKTFPDRFAVIECVEAQYEKTSDEIHQEIWTQMENLEHHE
jgi:dTMP kinase